jgi:hypothetical protein
MKQKDYLKEFIVWKPTGDPEVPFKTRHNGAALSVRLNDFPAEHLYTLIEVDSMVDFDDWPKVWTKSRARKPARNVGTTARAKTSGYAKTAAKTTKSKSLR